MVNAFVHTIMYTYYLLAMFTSLHPYLWWKKYITQMQLVQFVLVFFHSSWFLLDKTCDCPKPLTFLQCTHSVLFFAMFYSFYLRAYQRERKLKAAKLAGDALTRPDDGADQPVRPANDAANAHEIKKTN